MIVILIMSLVTYLIMVIVTKYKLPIAILGLATILIYGSISNTIPVNEVFQSFPVEIITLILVLSIFTKKFEILGFFRYASNLLIKMSKKNKIITIIFLIFITYISSLFMNNLSVVLLFTFICIKIAIELEIPTVPVLVSTIIASNIGGAALPWADTPAVVITLYTDFTLFDFLSMLFLPCLFFAILLIAYLMLYSKKLNKPNIITKANVMDLTYLSNDKHYYFELFHRKHPPVPIPPHQEHPPVPIPLHQEHPPVHLLKDPSHMADPKHSKDSNSTNNDNNNINPPKNTKQIILTSSLFILLIVGICIAPFVNVSIAVISMFFGSALLLFDRRSPEDAINTLAIMDSIVFISTLFLIGAVLEISGILSMVVDYIIAITGTNRYLIVLVIIMSAFIIATFLSAGPAAATLLPICSQLTLSVDYRIIYTALALGILAGSSTLPWSATGGPIMLGEVNRFLKQKDISYRTKTEVFNIFNLKQYLSFSIPFSLFILCCSILYLLIRTAILYA